MSITHPCQKHTIRAQHMVAMLSQSVLVWLLKHTICSFSKVDPGPFYQACVTDSCACDTGGDCECFCTAVAAYAKACTEASACVRWRTPKICRKFGPYPLFDNKRQTEKKDGIVLKTSSVITFTF